MAWKKRVLIQNTSLLVLKKNRSTLRHNPFLPLGSSLFIYEWRPRHLLRLVSQGRLCRSPHGLYQRPITHLLIIKGAGPFSGGASTGAGKLDEFLAFDNTRAFVSLWMLSPVLSCLCPKKWRNHQRGRVVGILV